MKSGLLCSTIGALLLAAAPSQAQQATKTYPTKQVRLVVPYPAGGPTDLIARLLSQKLGECLGQTFYVDNVSGASGALGAGQSRRRLPMVIPAGRDQRFCGGVSHEQEPAV
jgi:tripartite-type tricarboxylate transporter receptor subunit TctC